MRFTEIDKMAEHVGLLNNQYLKNQSKKIMVNKGT